MWPRADDPLYVAQPDQYRSELHDRFATPLYPLAFVILAYAFLGPPQTTRQSRTLALLGMIGTVSLLRLDRLPQRHRRRARAERSRRAIRRACSVRSPRGLWQISRGQAIEPAAAVSKIATAISERFAQATAS